MTHRRFCDAYMSKRLAVTNGSACPAAGRLTETGQSIRKKRRSDVRGGEVRGVGNAPMHAMVPEGSLAPLRTLKRSQERPCVASENNRSCHS